MYIHVLIVLVCTCIYTNEYTCTIRLLHSIDHQSVSLCLPPYIVKLVKAPLLSDFKLLISIYIIFRRCINLWQLFYMVNITSNTGYPSRPY